MKARSFGCLFVLSITALACAQGSTIPTGGPSGGGGAETTAPEGGNTGTETTGMGGTGEGGSSSTTASMTTTGSGGNTTTSSSTTTSSTTTTPPCSESPCKLTLPQCGCDAGEQCSVDANGRACIPEGDTNWGQICTGLECGPGLLCLLTTPTVSTCGKFCAKDADCAAPGGLCLLTLNDGAGGEIPNVKMCTDNCNPSTNTGCATGGCQILREQDGLMRFLTLCGESGPGTQGAPCVDNTDCAPTFGCFNDGTSDICLKWCNVAAPNCPGLTTCLEATINGDPPVLGNTQYGVCF